MMSTIVEESLFNTSVVFMDSLLSGFSNIVLYAIGLTSNVTEGWLNLSTLPVLDWQALFSYSEFQVALLKVFLFTLAFNLFCICIAWKLYGKNIYDTFMKPGKIILSLGLFPHSMIQQPLYIKYLFVLISVTPKIIEDLKKSVSRLNLPKEHSPRV